MVSKALEAVTPTLRDVAQWIGQSYSSARAYRQGDRTPPPKVIRKLARALRIHAAKLVQLAERLDAEAERDT